MTILETKESSKTVLVIELIRHGARSPKKGIYEGLSIKGT